MIFYHGTLRKHVASIAKRGIKVSAGWGGANTTGVYLAGDPKGALRWAITAYMLHIEEDDEVSGFDVCGETPLACIAVLKVTVPREQLVHLRADMEQAEDFQYEGDPEDWQAGLRAIGDVMFTKAIPPEWITEVPSKSIAAIVRGLRY